MQSSRRVCLLCRGIAHVSATPFLSRRAASSRATGTFDASKLVLDLDADDSKYVRRYEDMEHTKPARSFSSGEDDMELRKPLKSREEKVWEKQQNIPDSYRVLGIDLLKYALVQNPWRSISPETTYLRRTLTMNGLSPRLGTFKQHLDSLLAVSKNPYLEEGITPELSFFRFKTAVRNSYSLYEVNRLVTLFTATKANCVELSRNGWILTDAVILQRRNGNISVTRSLKFFNGAVQRLELMGVDPGLHLCAAGMYYAAKTRQHATQMRYVARAVQHNYPPSVHRARALGLVARRIDQPPKHEGNGVYAGRTNEQTRNDVLTLITGWTTDGVPKEGEQRQPCFGLLLGDDPLMVKTYLVSLAKLGATASLSHTFHHSDIGRTPTSTGYSDGLDDLNNRIGAFVGASMQGKNPIQVFEFLDYARTQSRTSEDEGPGILGFLEPESRTEFRRALKFYYKDSQDIRQSVAQDLKTLGLNSSKYVNEIFELLKMDGDGDAVASHSESGGDWRPDR